MIKRNKENGKKLIIGYFKNDECIKGIIKRYNNKKYEYEFKPDRKTCIGIEYSEDGNIKRKMEYDFHSYNYSFIAKNNSFGILYGDNNNIVYSGFLKNQKPKESKNIAIYNKNGIIMYSGGIIDYLYNGKGVEYYNDSNDHIYFSGIFNYGNYENGIMYALGGNKIYEGKFINNVPMEGKNIKLYNLDKYSIYEGDLLEGLYDNYGIIYSKYGQLIYEGGLEKGKYSKYGKYYDNFIEYEGEFLNGKYHG